METEVGELTELRRDIWHEKKDIKPQLWKVSDEKANKAGPHRSVFWVNEKKLTYEQRLELPVSKRKTKLWETGAVYSGEWKNNKRHGYGELVWPNGSKYEGDWANGYKDGNGTFFHKKNGVLRRVYAGSWKKGVKHGIGVHYYKRGDRYEGNWENGTRHGSGTQFYSNGDAYIGEWFQDQRCGWGRLIYKNGDEYDGEWLNDKREGQGQYYFKGRGRVYNGEWVEDIAKCGVYSEAPVGVDGTTAPWRRLDLPKLGLKDPDQVIETRVAAILNERSATRALPKVRLDDLFTAQEISDLRELFQSADSENNGQIDSHSFQELLESVGLSLTMEDVARVFLNLSKKATDLLAFPDFVKSIYLVKEIEQSSQSNQEDADDFEPPEIPPPVE